MTAGTNKEMPRLLSKKEPTKISEVRVEKKSGVKVERKPEQKSLKQSEPKREEEMSSWEYYSFLMRFGKRKMDRYEWRTWKVKKNEEDRYKNHLRKKYGPPKEKMSAAEFNWRVFHVGDIDESMVEVDYNL